MKGKTRTMLGAGVIALGALIALGPRYILPVCEYSNKDTAAATGTGMEGMSQASHGAMQGMSHGGAAMADMGATTTAAAEHMACFYTARASLVAGLLVALIGVAVILAGKVSVRRLTALVLAAAGVAVILTPLVLYPTCESAQMTCNQGARQLLIVLGVTVTLAASWLGLMPETGQEMLRESTADAS